MPANGRWPADLLVEVEPGNFLSHPTANAWVAMKAAASRDGVHLAIADPAGAYRSLFVQQDMRNRPWLYNLNQDSKAGLAAPGRSTHGNGDRLDAIGIGSLAWMLRNAARFGFTREFGASDPNHWKHDGRTAIAGSAQAVPLPTLTRGTHVELILIGTSPNRYAVKEDGIPIYELQPQPGATVQQQANMLAGIFGLTTRQPSGAEWAIAKAALAQAPVPIGSTVDVDEAALASALAPLLGGGVSDADLAAAVEAIKAAIPHTFTAA